MKTLMVSLVTALALMQPASAMEGHDLGQKSEGHAHGHSMHGHKPGKKEAYDPKTGAGVITMLPWVSAPPPGTKVHAAYLGLRNTTDTLASIIGIESPIYDKAEMHVSKVENGVATMQKLEQVDIPPGAMTAFEPGGLHIMLIGPKEKIAAGKVVPITLKFASGRETQVSAMVRKAMPGKGHHGTGHNH